MLIIQIISNGIIFYLTFPLWLQLLLLFFSLSYGGYLFWRYALLKHPQSIVKISHDNQSWIFHNRKQSFPVKLSGNTTLSFLVCIICFSTTGHRFLDSCVIFNDSLSNNDFRRLRVAIKFKNK